MLIRLLLSTGTDRNQGFVFGPIAFGPMSEVLGRKLPLFFGFALFAIFQVPVALAQNIETICVGRFLGGFFASAPLAVVGGALADLWDPMPRAYAICVFATGGKPSHSSHVLCIAVLILSRL